MLGLREVFFFFWLDIRATADGEGKGHSGQMKSQGHIQITYDLLYMPNSGSNAKLDVLG